MTHKHEPSGKKTRSAGQMRLLYAGLGAALLVGAWLVMHNPQGTFLAVAFIMGVLALLRGIIHLVGYFRLKQAIGWRLQLQLAMGILLTVLGILLIFWPNVLGSMLGWALAAWFIIEAVRGLGNIRALWKVHRRTSVLSIVLNILLLAAGVMLVFNPAPAVLTIPLLIALALILEGVLLLIAAFLMPSDSLS